MTETTLDLDLPELCETANEADMFAMANAYFGALKQVRGDLGSGRAELAATIVMLTERHREREEILMGRAHYLEDVLEKVLKAYPPTGKAKSRKLLAGTIGTRHSAGRYKITDGEKLVEWASDEPAAELIESTVVRHIPAKSLNEFLEPGQDEVPPGVEYVEPTDTFYASCA